MSDNDSVPSSASAEALQQMTQQLAAMQLINAQQAAQLAAQMSTNVQQALQLAASQKKAHFALLQVIFIYVEANFHVV